MNQNFHPFVIPFMLGVIFLVIVMIVRLVRWFRMMDKRQRVAVSRNIISFKTLKAIWETIRESLFHRNIFKTNFVLGYMHFCFAFGWLMLIVMGKVEEIFASGKIFTEPWLGIFFKYFEPIGEHYPLQGFFAFVMDLLLLFVLSGLILAFIKRSRSTILGLRKTTNHSPIDRTALTALWLIFPLRLFSESITASYKGNGGFLTQTIGNWLSVLPVETIELPAWWAYSIALCVFFALMPFTRYMHIFTEVLLIFLRKWKVVESAEKTGYTFIELYSCSRCGICIDTCQINSAANINNTQAVYFIRDVREEQLQDEIADNCLMCNRCTNACPVGIEQTQIRRIYRRKKGFDSEKLYDYIKPEAPKDAQAKVLYFAGCMSHLTPGIITAMKQILDNAKIDYHFLDEDKSICCGRPLKQQGFLEQANALMRKNSELINNAGGTVLVTSCPICYNSFAKDYNLSIPVMHHSQYIEQLLNEGKLKVSKKKELRIAYHDPCEISRGHNIYESPRNIITKVGELIPAGNEKDDSLCCGGSLANTIINPEQLTAIRNQTLDTLCINHPDILATSCPLCKKSFQRGGNTIKVMDIAELIALD
ncbi:(Fe-S)-binding protein [Bacteroidales bacterium OttesenSCG-928-B11]|nr:(Fe-S)-binding protein [Bacteroidales bacterium OttesenSCG-928-C03]MDL2311596.1 (Fe-S)-binding protein [Bacteroidales bacterium OttesenSCG-928-B11]MDL2326719.1 (Fe-S)-binding protein [Bacteroidales bacterium OttesenSCG-928-A14]